MGTTFPPWSPEELNGNLLCPAKAKEKYMDTPKMHVHKDSKPL